MATFIDERMRFFFVHVPKTGGMTVSRFFQHGGGRHWRLNRSFRNDGIGIHDGVERVNEVLGDAAATYFSFAYFRNSWDWAFSLYRYIKRTPGHPRFEDVRDLDFAGYVDRVAPGFYRPQRPLVCLDGEIAVTRLEDFRTIGETLPEILEELGYRTDRLVAENTAPDSTPYTEAYDARSRDRIAEIYRDDITFFDFRFGG
ncbi:hypothetical protein KHP62_01195 [Rhodobacteraceae bacterium NNCM2]|nr:hypothetical protein [Coraliihabitans acroporae]